MVSHTRDIKNGFAHSSHTDEHDDHTAEESDELKRFSSFGRVLVGVLVSDELV